jgi:hypothetical protein
MDASTLSRSEEADDEYGIDDHVESTPRGLDCVDHFRGPLSFSVRGERATKCAPRSDSDV